MSRRVASLMASVVLASCNFSPTGGAGDDVGPGIDAAEIDGSVIDAATDAPTDIGIDACAPLCSNNTIVACGEVIETCAAACSTVGPVHCTQLVASNGVTEDDVAGADVDLVLQVGRLYIFNTDSGEIRNYPLNGSGGGSVVRTAGPGLDGTSKIRFRSAAQAVPGGSMPAAELAYFGMKSLSIPATTIVRPVGSRGAVIVARGAMAIAGDVDVGGGRIQSAPGTASPTIAGPGGGRGGQNVNNNLAQGCAFGGAGTRVALNGGGMRDTGGGGGGLGTAGGKGGRATDTQDGGGVPIAAGVLPTACAQTNLIPLRGGSGGGSGRGSNHGGGGGGALQLTSLTAITVTAGTLYAGGAGGDGSTGPDGGGAGGAGGSVLLEAPALTFTGGSVTAGGGGGGAGNANTSAGENGQRDGTAALPSGNGGAGATGSAVGEVQAMGGGGDVPGTGGGGGGAGIIHFRSLSAPVIDGNAIIRPTASTSTATTTP